MTIPQCDDRDLQALINEAYGTLSLYITSRSTLRALYSGGKDSSVVAHLAAHHPAFNGVAHIRTLTGPASIRHSERVMATARRHDWHCAVRQPATTYPALVSMFGLPGPATHGYMYRYLKERVIRQLAQAIRQKDKASRALWVSGIRATESAARAQHATEYTPVSSGEWFVNPILNWTDQHVRDYLEAFGIEVAHMHHSVDCFCGAYADPSERAMIAASDPEQIAYIEQVEAIARAGRAIEIMEVESGVRDEKDVRPEEYCVWGHGLNKSRLKALRAESGVDLCNQCGVLNEVLTQRVEARR